MELISQVKLQLAYYAEKRKINVQNDVVEIKPFQIIVWVSFTSHDVQNLDANVPRLPAILDTGNNHNFALTETHLLRWAGIHPASLFELRKMREYGRKVPLHNAGLWLHTDKDPINLNVDEGIAIYTGDWPRLPTLGLRALTNNQLQTLIYGDTMNVIIRTRPKWYWPL
jgi:hypothetical protein